MSNYFDSMAKEWDNSDRKVERARVTAERIRSLNFYSTNSCIDFGSGTGLLGIQLSDIFTNIHLVDSSVEMLKAAQKKLDNYKINNVQTHHVDRLSELPTNHSAIVTMLVLHHIINIEQFFIDAYACLEPNGTLIIADLYKEDGSFHKHNSAFNGHHGFDLSELTTLVERIGFTVDKIECYYEIWQENFVGEKVAYPLFLLVAKKQHKIY